MELWIYDKILRFKGYDPLKRCKNHNYTIAEDALRMDLANDKTVWTNQFWEDYRSYIHNHHLLISIFAMPSLHPFSRKERICALFNELCLAFTMFVVFESLKVSTKFGVNGEKITTIFEAFITSSFGITLQRLGTCKNWQNKEDQERVKCEIWGDYTMALLTLICVLCALFSIWTFCEHYGTNVGMHMHLWISAQTLSWILDLFINVIQYVTDSRREKKNIEHQTCDLNVTYVDYLNWKATLMARHSAEIDTNRSVAPSVLLAELEEMEESHRRRSSLNPMINPRQSVDSSFYSTDTATADLKNNIHTHYMVDCDSNVSEYDKIRRLSLKYPQLKDKQMIVFVT